MTAKAIQGTYADFKIIKTRNIAQFIIEVPLEQANDAIALFGLPDPHIEKWVAVAMLQQNLLNRDESANKAIQIAGMLCNDPRFGEYLKTELGIPDVDPMVPDTIANGLRAILGIQSRTEMHHNSDAVTAFNRVKGGYDKWLITN